MFTLTPSTGLGRIEADVLAGHSWHTQEGFAAMAQAAGLVVDAIVEPGGRPATPSSTTFVFVLSPE